MTKTLKVLDVASEAQSKTSSMKGDLRRQIIVGVEVGRQAVQFLAANSTRAQVSAEVMSGRCLELEREITALRKQMDEVHGENLRSEVRSLRNELQSRKSGKVKDHGSPVPGPSNVDAHEDDLPPALH